MLLTPRELPAHRLVAVRRGLGAVAKIAVRLRQVESRQRVLVLELLSLLCRDGTRRSGTGRGVDRARALEVSERLVGLTAIRPQHA